MSSLWQTIIGAAAAIVGGFLAAWWQTSRADDVARQTRRAERREDGLLTLKAHLTSTRTQLDAIFRSVEGRHAIDPAKWEAAYDAMAELRALWEGNISARVPDEGIRMKYLEVRGQAHDLAPSRVAPMNVPDQSAMVDAARNFTNRIGTLLARVDEFRAEVDVQVDGLLGVSAQRPSRSAGQLARWPFSPPR